MVVEGYCQKWINFRSLRLDDCVHQHWKWALKFYSGSQCTNEAVLQQRQSTLFYYYCRSFHWLMTIECGLANNWYRNSNSFANYYSTESMNSVVVSKCASSNYSCKQKYCKTVFYCAVLKRRLSDSNCCAAPPLNPLNKECTKKCSFTLGKLFWFVVGLLAYSLAHWRAPLRPHTRRCISLSHLCVLLKRTYTHSLSHDRCARSSIPSVYCTLVSFIVLLCLYTRHLRRHTNAAQRRCDKCDTQTLFIHEHATSNKWRTFQCICMRYTQRLAELLPFCFFF